MSYLSGIVCRHQGKCWLDRRSDLLQARRALEHRGPASRWVAALDGGATFLAGGYDWSGWDLLFDRETASVVALDARIDNLAELREELGLSPEASPARVAWACWQTWGMGFSARLVGEFALVIATSSELRLARDPTGLRPLFHCEYDGHWFVASEIRALLACSRRPPEPNLGLITDYLLGTFPQRSETFFEGVYRLPQGQELHAGSSTGPMPRQVRRSLRPPTAWDRSQDPIEELRRAVTQAVRRELAAAEGVGVLLSGGLDSTAILSVVDVALAPLGRTLRDVLVFSSTLSRIPACDERPLIEETARQYRIEPSFIPSDRLWALCRDEERPQVRLSEPWRGQLLDQFEVAQVEAAARAGARHLLTGYGGDEVLTASLWHLRDLRNEGREGRLRQEVASLPEPYRRIVEEVLSRSPSDPPTRPPHLQELPDDLWEQHVSRLLAPDWEPTSQFDSLADWDAHRCATGLGSGVLAEISRGVALESGVQLLSPWLDHQVVTRALALSHDVKLQDGYLKNAARKFLTSRAPVRVLQQKQKGHLNGLVDFGLRFRERTRVEEALSCTSLIEVCRIPPSWPTRARELYRSNPDEGRSFLLKLVSLGLWCLDWFE